MHVARRPPQWHATVALVLLAVALRALVLRAAQHRATAHPRSIELHVKVRSERARLTLTSDQGAPLFTHLAPGTHDDRARWRRVLVPLAPGVDPERAAAALRADPAVEDALVRPVATLPNAGFTLAREDEEGDGWVQLSS